jgi:hypothetical protein
MGTVYAEVTVGLVRRRTFGDMVHILLSSLGSVSKGIFVCILAMW